MERLLSGVLSDSRMPVKVEGKVYKTIVRPAMIYGAECWIMKKAHEKWLHTSEIKMLRLAGGVTRLDEVRIEYIGGPFKVAPIAEKYKKAECAVTATSSDEMTSTRSKR